MLIPCGKSFSEFMNLTQCIFLLIVSSLQVHLTCPRAPWGMPTLSST
jgi:hypothetical protein